MRSLRVVVVALVGVLLLAAGGCGGDEDGGAGGGASATTATSGGGGEELKLTAKDIKWDTTTLQLTSGTSYRVEVTNDDSVEHNFTFAEASADQDVEGGENATVTFTAPAAGSYEFFCKYHQQGMRGTVTVT
jgi:nitrite reductase (NO-forming)